MECKLVIKDYNGLYTIYLTKLYKVLVRIIIKVIIVVRERRNFKVDLKEWYKFYLNLRV
jgi:hypothetical protein